MNECHPEWQGVHVPTVSRTTEPVDLLEAYANEQLNALLTLACKNRHCVYAA